MTRDAIYSTLSVCLVVGCVLSTIPLAEVGMNDDFSYTFIARGLARTGHLRYDGWVTPMIGFQAGWGALWIRLLGFSFTLVRFSILPFAAGCAFLIYRLSREAGLNASLSLFGTLTVALSPLFIPLAASFMTDVPGLFFWLACIYCGVRAARAAGPGAACGWLAASAASGVAGGTVRQAVWIAPLLVVPAVAFVRRRERVTIACAATFWCFAAILILICLRWFQAQPYVQIEAYSVETESFSRDFLAAALRLPVGCLMFILPILLVYLTAFRLLARAARKEFPGVFAGLLLMGTLLVAASWLGHGRWLLGNTVTTTGIVSAGTEAFGRKPVILTEPILWVIRIVLLASAAATFALLIGRRASSDESFRVFLLIYMPPVAAYVLAILYHTLDGNELFDRYLFELLPLLAIALLWRYQQTIRATVPIPGWIGLVVLALYGIATTHDAFAAARARVRAASALIASGIPRTRITAGFTYDGWTELEHSGHINSDNMLNPQDAYRSQEDRHYAVSKSYWFWGYTPSIEPTYFVVDSRVNGLIDAPFSSVPFTAWIPPFHRNEIIQRSASAAVR